MMMLLFSIIFMIPLCLMNFWWELVSIFLLLMFIFLSSSWVLNYFTSISYSMGGDLLSFGLIILSFFIVSLMFLASFKLYVNKQNVSEFMLVCLFLLLFLLLTFMTTNLFLFYLFFECSLIPTLFLIFGWGYQPERLSAGFYLLFYTLFASLPLLLSIFYIYKFSYSLFIFLIYVNPFVNFYLYLGLFLAFMIKLPIIMFHFWLPKAHVEAPVSGSMILAGILLKLGGYGLLRVLHFISDFSFKYNYIFMGFSLFGIVMVGFLCLIQIDIKSLIAYSSVAHMGLVICGIMTLNLFGFLGSFILMVGHGLCSSAMFSLANILYERSHSRSLLVNKGLICFMPSMSLFWFLLSVNNMASPPSLNLLGEIILINSIISWSSLSFIFLSFSSFFSCCYSIYLYANTQHGSLYSGYNYGSYGSTREFLVIFLHWFPLNLLIMKTDFLLFLI